MATVRQLDLASVAHRKVDGPAASCAFDSYDCSRRARGAGGFDEHHPWPVELGGPAVQGRLVLCPSHHRRQHALIRALVEGGGTVPWSVAGRFTAAERRAAERAWTLYRDAGEPRVKGWPCPAATPREDNP